MPAHPCAILPVRCAKPAALLLCALFFPQAARAVDFKRMAIKTLFCGGGAYGGYKLGEKIANMEAVKRNLSEAEARKQARAIQIGMAAALCGTGVLLTGTVYAKLSKRDREARDKEMAAAVAETNPGTHRYVLPDSKLPGTLTTEASHFEDGKECRWQVDVLSSAGEPARTKFCRKSPNDRFELEL
jgi:hypothetical protein